MKKLLFVFLLVFCLDARAAMITADLQDPPRIVAGSKSEVRFSLNKEGKPVTMDNLKELHTRKIHALIVNPDLTDYTHEHPIPAEKEGEYKFSFNPKTDNSYKIWLDITPQLGEHQYIPLIIKGGSAGRIDKKQVTEASAQGYDFKLSFDSELVKGKASMGSLQVTKSGQPFTKLEPVMGAFAHIVGFYDDYKTIAHIHPMGQEPQTESERGGPELMFHLEPKKNGFIKLFAQVRIGGQDIYVPFGVMVK